MSVDVSQVLSTLLSLLSTSREAHTSSTTMQELKEVSFLQEKYVLTEVLAVDRATSISIRSYIFNHIIHHLRPTTNDAGPHEIGFEDNLDVQTSTTWLGI